jgi:hypothetical protein
VKNFGQRAQALFTGVENFCILACELCKNGWENYPTPFTKVVEECKIDNFGIGHFGHFSSTFLSKCWSNCAKPNLNSPWNAPVRNVVGAPCLPAAVPHRMCTHATSGPSATPWLLCVTLLSVLASATPRSPTRRTAAPPYTIGRSPLHVATPLRPCHAHAATPLLTTVVTPSPRRTCLYKRPSPLESSASATQSLFSCPPWPPVGELLPPVASISFWLRLSLPTSPRSPTETLLAVGLSPDSANSPEQTVPRTQTPWHRRALSPKHLPPPPTPQTNPRWVPHHPRPLSRPIPALPWPDSSDPRCWSHPRTQLQKLISS